MNSSPAQRAEVRIAELGIRDPADLDVDAIAFDAGMQVLYEPDLQGCEATLVGFGDRAIATIKKSPVRGRERFSIGHELGHWELHRGRSFRCRVDDPVETLASDSDLEQQADDYASHLLFPTALFNPAIKSMHWPTLAQLEDVARLFSGSQSATLVRLVRADTLPVVIACYTRDRLRWKIAAKHIPWRWRIRGALDRDSFAFELLERGTPSPKPRKQSAETWFVNEDAGEYELLEQCYSPLPGQVMVVLYLSDIAMLEARYDPNLQYDSGGRI
jgi:hypothetical protein